ncbi:MAG: hypothetical protein J7639_33520 [Paenibacillaceae bacterium]|nr:hypothetical protein [Paenibacillaceae bacterium]
MPLHESAYRKTYLVVNHTVLVLLSLLCIAPLIHILAVSFSSSTIPLTKYFCSSG